MPEVYGFKYKSISFLLSLFQKIAPFDRSENV